MRRIRAFVAAVAAVCVTMLLLAASSTVLHARSTTSAKASMQTSRVALDITGKWLFNVQLDAGSGTPTVTFKQDGEKLTGHYSSQTLGELDFTGSIKEKALTFKLKGDVGGQTLEVTYSGTVTDSVSMKGTVDFGGMASGTFTGKKQ